MSSERSKSFDCTLNKYDTSIERDIELSEVERAFKLISQFYVIILHDKDIDEQGELKKPHYHIYFTTDVAVGKMRMVKTLTLALKLKSSDNIHVLTSLNSILSCRYLLHLDHIEKYQYSCTEVVSNDFSKFQYFVNRDTSYTEDVILEIAVNCDNFYTFLKKIGINQYEKHWRVYDKIFEFSRLARLQSKKD